MIERFHPLAWILLGVAICEGPVHLFQHVVSSCEDLAFFIYGQDANAASTQVYADVSAHFRSLIGFKTAPKSSLAAIPCNLLPSPSAVVFSCFYLALYLGTMRLRLYQLFGLLLIPAASAVVTYDDDIFPRIFAPRCVSCHGAGFGQAGLQYHTYALATRNSAHLRAKSAIDSNRMPHAARQHAQR
ncbi:MAG: hypothetical protein ACI8W8_001931 [Rhodothermales bacterium]